MMTSNVGVRRRDSEPKQLWGILIPSWLYSFLGNYVFYFFLVGVVFASVLKISWSLSPIEFKKNIVYKKNL